MKILYIPKYTQIYLNSPGLWPSGVLDPLRARRRPRRVGFCDHCSYQIENSYNVFLLRIYNPRIFLPQNIILEYNLTIFSYLEDILKICFTQHIILEYILIFCYNVFLLRIYNLRILLPQNIILEYNLTIFSYLEYILRIFLLSI